MPHPAMETNSRDSMEQHHSSLDYIQLEVNP